MLVTLVITVIFCVEILLRYKQKLGICSFSLRHFIIGYIDFSHRRKVVLMVNDTFSDAVNWNVKYN